VSAALKDSYLTEKKRLSMIPNCLIVIGLLPVLFLVFVIGIKLQMLADWKEAAAYNAGRSICCCSRKEFDTDVWCWVVGAKSQCLST